MAIGIASERLRDPKDEVSDYARTAPPKDKKRNTPQQIDILEK
jgi:hypothetical protein